ERIHLDRGETRTGTFTIAADLRTFYNADLEYVCEPGAFEVMVGPNCMEVERRRFELVK
ncbi:MAG: fibronectin type III-like domain-contianing protein, partial [Alistipes sp.]|nr:fibronectin type III-like domain-contianing protein [Alistipes sp.]